MRRTFVAMTWAVGGGAAICEIMYNRIP
jgi:hypothetical protein